ncbi:HNH endonuclease [Sphingomonas sp. ac-8]|uniref:HNH endonuclease n=1 Tax=Sphingomonas sp. ac-8 TaxID=3242977 RepID=UPI003A811183
MACEKAGRVTPATIVDHVLALAEGGADDDGNRQALCKRHHDAKSAAEAARGRARRRLQRS